MISVIGLEMKKFDFTMQYWSQKNAEEMTNSVDPDQTA